MPAPELFSAIAGALLDHRIRNMRRLDEKTWIDTSLITHAEYQIFLDEMSPQGKYHQPDHWRKTHFSTGEQRMPVVGVRPSDAIAFCTWLSGQAWGKFRLPFAKETPELEGTLPGFWQFKVPGEREVEYKGQRVLFNASDSDRAFDLTGDLDRALNLDRALDLDRTPDRTLVRDLNRNIKQHDYMERERTLASDFVRDLARNLDLALAHTRNRNFTNDLDLDRARDLARDLARNRNRARNLASDLARKLNRNFTDDLDRTLDLELDRYLKNVQEQLLPLISSLLILTLRREGLLPAFEGILIVREDD